MKVAHITTVPHQLNFLEGQAGYMRERGVDLHLLCSPTEDVRDASGAQWGIEMFGAREEVAVHPVRITRRMTPLHDAVSLVRIVRTLRRIRPAIVHAHSPKGGLLGMLGGWLSGTPVRIYHLRGSPVMTARGLERRVLWLSERVACRLAHRVLCISGSFRDAVVARGLCAPERIRVIAAGSGNGVDAEQRFDPARIPPGTRERTRARYGIPEGARVVGYVGRIVRDKGIVELVRAWRMLRKRHPYLHLLLVGPFEHRDPIPIETRSALESEPGVHLTGQSMELPALYAAMDVFVLPSYREGFGAVLIEAAAMGLPTVATRIPGCVDAVADGRTGTLVEPQDAQALAAAIERYLLDPELCRRHGAAGRERALSDFRPESIWAAIHGEYEELLAPKTTPNGVRARVLIRTTRGVPGGGTPRGS